jgi:Fic family protein
MWNGRRVQAWLPDPVGDLHIGASTKAERQLERAAAAVRRAGDRIPAGWEPLARLLLHAEGLASSSIEGLRAPMADIAAARLEDDAASQTAAWVADNLAVVEAALAARSKRLTEKVLHRWHTTLMGHSHIDDRFIGRFRDEQGWIGGRTPLDAAFVPPPPDRVRGLMRDLITYANRGDVDPVAQAAVVHAQFETIHPYGDGNGRLGRVLVLWVLARTLEVAVPPPVSVFIARETGGYLSGLYWFRTGEVDRWLEWFARVVAAAGEAAITWATDVAAVMDDWRTRVDLRADAAAHLVVDLLPAHPVLSADVVAAELGVSARAGRTALEQLAERGIVEPYEVRPSKPGRPRHYWVARRLVDLVTTWAG